MVSKDRYAVHQSHCCEMHGCKYSDEDCPVANGEIVQEYLCEDCPPDYKIGMSHTLTIDQETFSNITSNKTPYLVFNTQELKLAVGTTVVLYSTNKEKIKRVICHIASDIPYMTEGYAIMTFYNYGNEY